MEASWPLMESSHGGKVRTGLHVPTVRPKNGNGNAIEETLDLLQTGKCGILFSHSMQTA